MKLKREIHGLEQAISFFVSILQQRLFYSKEFDRVWSRSEGFKYELSEGVGSIVHVTIYPAGWPNGSYIYVAFSHQLDANWSPLEGNFHAPHIPMLTSPNKSAIFEFKVGFHPERLLNFEPFGTDDIPFVNALNMFTKL